MTLRDTKAETERTIRAAERGIILVDEARAVFGLNPLPNGAGQVRLVPVNMSLVDKNNQVVLGGVSTPEKDEEKPDEETDETKEEATAEKGVGLRIVK